MEFSRPVTGFAVRIAADADQKRRSLNTLEARSLTTDGRESLEAVWCISGLRVAADRPLVELEPCTDPEVDLQVLFRADPGGEVEVGVLSSADSSGDWFKLMDEDVALAWIRADGRLALVAETEALVRGFDVAVRRVVPFAAALQGRVMLHAAAVLADDGVHAFIGASGAGKSTLVEGLGKQGLPVLTDDLLLCLPTDSGVVVPPCQPDEGGDSVSALTAVYFIERDPALKELSLEELPDDECFKRLLQHGFGELGVPKIWAAQFELYSMISEQCRAHRLQLPDSLDRLPDATETLARKIVSGKG